jgi:hypothetical protein
MIVGLRALAAAATVAASRTFPAPTVFEAMHCKKKGGVLTQGDVRELLVEFGSRLSSRPGEVGALLLSAVAAIDTLRVRFDKGISFLDFTSSRLLEVLRDRMPDGGPSVVDLTFFLDTVLPRDAGGLLRALINEHISDQKKITIFIRTPENEGAFCEMQSSHFSSEMMAVSVGSRMSDAVDAVARFNEKHDLVVQPFGVCAIFDDRILWLEPTYSIAACSLAVMKLVDPTQCPICKEMLDAERAEVSFACGHAAHVDCIQKQVGSGALNSCPLCRAVISRETREAIVLHGTRSMSAPLNSAIRYRRSSK